MKVYAVLMRRRGHERHLSDFPLEWAVTPDERKRLQAEVQSHGIQLLDIITSLGMFEIVLVCRAERTEIVGNLLNRLAENWHTEALLATSHVRWEFADTHA